MPATQLFQAKSKSNSIVCVLLLAVVSVIRAEPESNVTPAPRFTARDINNHLISTDSLLTHGPLIINFWATWCTPCMAEFKAIKKLVGKYKDKSITVLAVNQDGPSEVAKVKQMVTTNRWPFIVIMDNGRRIAEKFNVSAMPTLFLIGSDGNIHLYSRGYVAGDEKKLEKELLKLAADQ